MRRFLGKQAAHGISTGFCALRNRQLLGEVHDENCAALGSVAGHCGLFSTGAWLDTYLKEFLRSSDGQTFWNGIDQNRFTIRA